MKYRKGNWFQTYTGRQFWPVDVHVDDIAILDIAHALARVCRFGGHVESFYSVAQHSVHVSQILPDKLKLWGLLHDATEAYLGDMVRPLKQEIPQYKVIENNLMCVIAQKFGLALVMPPEVKEADVVLLATERRDLLGGKKAGTWDSVENVKCLRARIYPWTPDIAETQFLDHFMRLTNPQAAR